MARPTMKVEKLVKRKSSAAALVDRLRRRQAVRWVLNVLAANECPGCMAAQCDHCRRQLDRLVVRNLATST